jgi:hypothetical protein
LIATLAGVAGALIATLAGAAGAAVVNIKVPEAAASETDPGALISIAFDGLTSVGLLISTAFERGFIGIAFETETCGSVESISESAFTDWVDVATNGATVGGFESTGWS